MGEINQAGAGYARGAHSDLERWLIDFNAAVEERDAGRCAELIHPTGFLKDIVALTWSLRTFRGRVEIEKAFAEVFGAQDVGGFWLRQDVEVRHKEMLGRDTIEAFLEFETSHGVGDAVLRLTPDERGRYLAYTLSTGLRELHAHPWRVGEHRPVGTPSLDTFGGENWLDRRRRSLAYADRDPEVLVIGAGQCGLSVAARLNALDVDALVIERLPRVGDIWRRRYHSLTLHNPTWINHLPYLPFPDTFPVYMPKDKLGDWLEFYADALEINVWASTEVLGGTFSEEDRCWIVTVRGDDGSERELRPKHVVMATGASGKPKWPEIEGLGSFEGRVLHSAEYEGGSKSSGVRAIVFGTGNSAHDVAQDLVVNGDASVTMVQRSSTTVVDIETVQTVYERHSTRLSRELADLSLLAAPYEVVLEAFQAMTTVAMERDRELIGDLNRAGFRTDWGHDESGHRMKFLRYGGGYYINIGCSDLIVDGRISLMDDADIERVCPSGLQLRDGREVPADMIVLATGYEGMSSTVAQIFGEEVAQRVGPVWGYDDEGELQNVHKPTAQEGLWFCAGSFAQARMMSTFLALQLKARLEGYVSP